MTKNDFLTPFVIVSHLFSFAIYINKTTYFLYNVSLWYNRNELIPPYKNTNKHSMKRSLASLAFVILLSQFGLQNAYAAISSVERLATTTDSAIPRPTNALNSSGEFDMSNDGRYLTFISNSSLDNFNYQSTTVPYDLDNYFFPDYPGDIIHPEWQSATYGDVMVYDTVEKKYELVSRVSNGRQGKTMFLRSPVISGSGRYVAFDDGGAGGSSSLIEDDDTGTDVDNSGNFPITNQYRWDLLVFDRETNHLERIKTFNGDEQNSNIFYDIGGNSYYNF